MAIYRGRGPFKLQWMVLVGWMLVFMRCQDLAPSAGVLADDGLYEVPLQPFQILLQYDDNAPMAMSDEMMVLNSTQSYLSSRLRENEPDFSSLFLYQFVRHFVAYSQGHYSKIAINGIIYFNTPMSPTRQREVQAQILQSLMGAKVEYYIDDLHAGGMTHVVNATLLSMQGIEMTDNEGQIVERNQSGLQSENEYTRDMDEDTRTMTLLLCLLVPGIAIVIAAAAFACRFARDVSWKRVTFRNASDQSAWRSREFRVGDSTSPAMHKSRNGRHPDRDSDKRAFEQAK